MTMDLGDGIPLPPHDYLLNPEEMEKDLQRKIKYEQEHSSFAARPSRLTASPSATGPGDDVRS